MSKFNINFFIGYYQDKYNEVSQLDKKYLLYKKALYYIIIDGLSKSIYPRLGNCERMVTFINEITKWDEGKLLSLPHLYGFFKIHPEPKYAGIRKFINEKYSKLIPGQVYTINQIDIFDTDFMGLLTNRTTPNIFDRNIKGSIYQVQHYNLFYKYRNALLHEMRPLSGEISIEGYDVPHYIHMTTESNIFKGENGYWSLYYSESFLNKLCKDSILFTKDYLANEMVDPLAFVDNGNYWVEELNI